METKTSNYNPIVSQMNIDFLLSIYTSIKSEQSSIYNLPEANKDLVEKNRVKDEVIKKRIQNIIIESLTVSDKITSYSFVKTLLDAFDMFILTDEQIERILEYLVRLLDAEETREEKEPIEERKVAKKVEKDTKKKADKFKEEKLKEAKEPEEEIDDSYLIVPAILNFLTGFLSKTPQDIDLTEHRLKRNKYREAKSLRKRNIEDEVDNEDLEDENKKDDIEGFNAKTFVKENKVVDESGNPLNCTFAKTRRNFTNQPWYECYTCGLSKNEGICTI